MVVFLVNQKLGIAGVEATLKYLQSLYFDLLLQLSRSTRRQTTCEVPEHALLDFLILDGGTILVGFISCH